MLRYIHEGIFPLRSAKAIAAVNNTGLNAVLMSYGLVADIEALAEAADSPDIRDRQVFANALQPCM